MATAAVIFWVALTLVSGALFTAWYRYAKPRRRFEPDKCSGRFRTIARWDTMLTRKECPTCGGWGDLLLQYGKLVKIPRHRWEHARWVGRGMTMTCPSCLGTGSVPKNLRPAA